MHNAQVGWPRVAHLFMFIGGLSGCAGTGKFPALWLNSEALAGFDSDQLAVAIILCNSSSGVVSLMMTMSLHFSHATFATVCTSAACHRILFR